MTEHVQAANYTASVGLKHSPIKEDVKKKYTHLPSKFTFARLLKDSQVSIQQSEQRNQLEVQLSPEEQLSRLQDLVRSTGDALKEAYSSEAIFAYKKAVKDFAEQIIKKNYTTESKNIIRMNRQTGIPETLILTKIKIIDEKLDKFIFDLLYDQADQLLILQRTEEIYGLLIDLLS